MQHSKSEGFSLKRKITASLLALTIVGTSASPMFSSVVASAASGDDYAGANEDYDFSVPVNGSNKENQTVTIGGNTENIFWANASYYDYMTDNEVKSGWLQNMTQAGTWHEGAKDDWYPFKKFNKYISSLVTNSWKEPLYFGNFYNGNDGPYADSSHNGGYMNAIEGLNNFVHAPNNSRKGVVGHDSIYHESGATQTGIDEEHQSYQRLVDSNLSGGQLTVAGGTPAPYFTQNDYTKVLKSAFPFREETHEDYTKYIFQSSTGDNNQNAADNVYFNWSGDTPTKVNYSYGEKHAVKDAKRYFMYNESSGYGFYPFNEPGGETTVSTRKYLYASVNNQEVGWTNLMVYFIGADSSWDNKHQMEWVRDEDDGKNKVFRYLIPDNATGFVLTNGSGGNENQTVNGSFDDLKFGAVYVDKNTDGGKRKIGRWQQRPSVAGIIDYSTGTEILDHGFGVHMNVKFRVPKGGVAKDGTVITFDFAGDDDLWMFITDDITKESQLVLDMGGNHKKSTGQVNFKDLNSTVNAYNGSGSTTKFTFDYSHTYTMDVFYMERGMIESNCDMSFTMTPLGNNFIVTEEIDTTKVNKGLKEAVTGLSSFTFTPQGGTYDPDNGLSYNVDGEVHNKSGKSSVDLKDGQTLMIPNLFKINDNINLVQTRGDSVLKYSTKYVYKNNTTGRKLDENSHDATVETVTTEKGYLSNTGTDAGDPYEFAELEANFVNTPVVADVTLDKETVDFLRDSLDSGDKGQSDEFPVTVDINFGGSQTLFDFEYTASDIDGTQTASNGVLNIKDGRTITIPNVPVGSTITVSEALTENFDKKEFTDKDGKALKDDKDQPLETYSFTLGEDGGSAFIRNIRKDPDDAKDKVKLNKTITIGLDNAKVTLKDGYEFQLLYNGEVIDTQTIQSAASSASTAFKELTFTVDKTKDSEDYRKQGVFYVTPENLRNGGTQTFNFTVHENLTDAQKKVISAPEDEEVTFEISYDKEKNILTTDPVMQGNAAPEPKDTAEFVNPYKVADLIISKTVARSDGKDPDEQDRRKEFKTTISFTFNNRTFPEGLPLYYTYSDDGGTPHQLVNNQIVLKHNRKVTFSGLPLGTKVQISEQDDSEYSVKYEPQETDIVVDTTIYMNVTNTRQAPGTATVTVKKSFENSDVAAKAGVTLANAGFRYKLTETTPGEANPFTAEKVGDSDTVNFDIKFEHAGTRKFKVEEETGTLDNIEYDKQTFNVEIKAVVENKVLKIEYVKYFAFDQDKQEWVELKDVAPTFVNTYKVGTVTFDKSVVDENLRSVSEDTTAFPAAVQIKYPNQNGFSVQSFTMDVTDNSGAAPVTETVTVTDGKITIKNKCSYTIKELPVGTDVEVQESDTKGYLNAPARELVLKAEEASAAAAPAASTIYNQKVALPVELSAKKQTVDFNLEKGAFSFKLYRTGSEILQTKTNDAQGDVKFDRITYEVRSDGKDSTAANVVITPDDFSANNTYTDELYISEIAVRDSDSKIDYSSAVYKAVVTVTRTPATGGLYTYSTSVEYKDENDSAAAPNFINKWKKAPVTIKKVVEDYDGTGYDTDLSFVINVSFTYPEGYTGAKYENKPVTLSKQNNFSETFTDLPYGTVVKAVERDGDTHGMDVSYSPEKGQVTVDGTAATSAITVTNKRKKPSPTSINVDFSKQLLYGTLAKGQFTFELTAGEGIAAGTRKTNDADGKIDFGKVDIKYVKEKPAQPETGVVYLTDDDFKNGRAQLSYTATEVVGGEADIKYDENAFVTNTYTITKTVKDNVTELTATGPVVTKEKMGSAVPDKGFINSKEGEITITKTVRKIDDTGKEVDIDPQKDTKAANETFMAALEFADPGSEEFKSRSFSYSYKDLDGKEGTVTADPDEEYNLELKHGRVITLKGLPYGTQVEITEAKNSNYTPKYPTKIVTVGSDITALSVTNVLQKPGQKIVTFSKTFSEKAVKAGANKEGSGNVYKFTMTGDAGNAVPALASYSDTVTLDQYEGGVLKASGSFKAIDFPADFTYGADGKVFKFTVREIAVDSNDKNIINDTAVYTVSYKVTQGAEGLDIEGPEITRDPVDKDNPNPTEVKFENKYELGNAQVVKVVKDFDDKTIEEYKDVRFTVDVTFDYPGGTSETKSGEILTVNEPLVYTELPVGTKVSVVEKDAHGMDSTVSEPVFVKADAAGTPVTVTVTNKRVNLTPAEVEIPAYKSIQGADIADYDGKFTFELSSNELRGTLTKTNDAEGKITFDKIFFRLKKSETDVSEANTILIDKTAFKGSEPLTYSFKVKEKEPEPKLEDVTIDANEYTVTVTVSKTEDYSSIALSAAVKQDTVPTFTNTKLGKVSFEKKAIDIDGTSYEPDIDFIFKAEKKVGENRWETLTGGERIVINLAKGVKSYETAYLPVGTVVRFTETDSKNFTTTPEAGYQEITVQKDQTASFTFVNTHPEPEGSYLDVSAKKILEGASLEEGKFSFTLNGKIVVDDKTTLTIDEQTKTNAQDGSIKFDRINFSLEKEVAGALKLTKAMFAGAADKTLPIELTVTENKDDSKKDIRYPEQLSQTIKGTITLIDEGSDAHLVAVLTENTLPTFTNVQLARVGFTKAAKDIDGTSFKPDTNFEFSAWKQNGNEWELLEDKIIINIGDSDTSNDSYVTDYLPINTLVKFQEDDAAGFTSLTPVQTVPVTLEKDGKFSTVEFTNKRPVPGTTSAVLKAVKLLEGAQLKDGDFSFTISGEGADANKEYTNKGGNITFDEITYKYSKDDSEVTSGSTVVLHDGDFKNGKAVFEYTITEKNTGRPDVLYAVNGSTVTGKVTITKTETASTITLQASTPEYPGGNTFTNKIRKGSAKIVKTNQADEMVDDVTFKLYKVSGNNLDRNQVLSNNAIDVQTTVDGVAEFKNLDLYVDAYQSISDPTYQWYCIAETDPSKEYNLNSGLTFFQVPSADVYDLTFEYMNGKVISPTSGGTGMRMFTVAGLSLLGFGGLAFAGYMLMMRRSNKKRAHYRADK